MKRFETTVGYLTGAIRADNGSEVWNVGFDSTEESDTALSACKGENEGSRSSPKTGYQSTILDLVRETLVQQNSSLMVSKPHTRRTVYAAAGLRRRVL